MIPLLLTICGLVLLAMDRVLSKERVIIIDDKLVRFCQSVGPFRLNAYKPAVILLMLIGFVALAPFMRGRMLSQLPTGYPPPFDLMRPFAQYPKMSAFLIWLATGVLLFLIGVVQTATAYAERVTGSSNSPPSKPQSRHKRRKFKRRRKHMSPTIGDDENNIFLNLVIVPVLGMLAWPVIGLIGIIHLGLMAFIYPLKPILIFNGRMFSSFSGVIGLVLAITGAILQFRGC